MTSGRNVCCFLFVFDKSSSRNSALVSSSTRIALFIVVVSGVLLPPPLLGVAISQQQQPHAFNSLSHGGVQKSVVRRQAAAAELPHSPLDAVIDTAFRMVGPIFNVESALKQAAKGLTDEDSPVIGGIGKKEGAERLQRELEVLGAPKPVLLSNADLPLCRENSQICRFISCTAHNFKHDDSMQNLNLAVQLISDAKLRKTFGSNPETIVALCKDQGLSRTQCRLFAKAFLLIDQLIESIEGGPFGSKSAGAVGAASFLPPPPPNIMLDSAALNKNLMMGMPTLPNFLDQQQQAQIFAANSASMQTMMGQNFPGLFMMNDTPTAGGAGEAIKMTNTPPFSFHHQPLKEENEFQSTSQQPPHKNGALQQGPQPTGSRTWSVRRRYTGNDTLQSMPIVALRHNPNASSSSSSSSSSRIQKKSLAHATTTKTAAAAADPIVVHNRPAQRLPQPPPVHVPSAMTTMANQQQQQQQVETRSANNIDRQQQQQLFPAGLGTDGVGGGGVHSDEGEETETAGGDDADLDMLLSDLSAEAKRKRGGDAKPPPLVVDAAGVHSGFIKMKTIKKHLRTNADGKLVHWTSATVINRAAAPSSSSNGIHQKVGLMDGTATKQWPPGQHPPPPPPSTPLHDDDDSVDVLMLDAGENDDASSSSTSSRASLIRGDGGIVSNDVMSRPNTALGMEEVEVRARSLSPSLLPIGIPEADEFLDDVSDDEPTVVTARVDEMRPTSGGAGGGEAGSSSSSPFSSNARRPAADGSTLFLDDPLGPYQFRRISPTASISSASSSLLEQQQDGGVAGFLLPSSSPTLTLMRAFSRARRAAADNAGGDYYDELAQDDAGGSVNRGGGATGSGKRVSSSGAANGGGGAMSGVPDWTATALRNELTGKLDCLQFLG